MNIKLNTVIADKYKNNSQKIRVISEFWVKKNAYCPNCGSKLSKFKNNKPVADFFCSNCKEEFELKSKNSTSIGRKIVDGAYYTMIKRINEDNNPNFFFLTYNKSNFEVNNFLIIPNFYFVPNIVEKRKPLSNTARRAGWVGCNILLNELPENSKIYLIKNSSIIDKKIVLKKWSKSLFLKSTKGESKGWILDIMNCVDKIDEEIFELNDVYRFESILKEKHPQNNFIRDKIRQQLQILRDKGMIEFLERGKYRKLNI